MMDCLRGRQGHTLMELLAAVAVFTVGILGAWSAVDDATRFSAVEGKKLVDRDRSRGLLAPLSDLVGETKAAFVDTSMRYVNRSSGLSFSSDRFEVPGVHLRHCSSPVCGFHTNRALGVTSTAYECGYQHLEGTTAPDAVRGKTWPADLSSCPLDGSPLSTNALMDGVKILTSRGLDGTFLTDADGTPAWNGIALLFPYQPSHGFPELRRFDFQVSDLLAAGTPYYSAWTQFDPTNPNMVDLLDFGTDGTIDGIPDGRVPVTAADCDADQEIFLTGLHSGVPAIIYEKTLGASGSYPHRRVSLTVHLEDGWTSFSAEHYLSSTIFWRATVSLTRTPRTLISHVTEFAASTKSSHPYHQLSNPSGVADDGIVRFTLATTTELVDKGVKSWAHHLDTCSFKPRN